MNFFNGRAGRKIHRKAISALINSNVEEAKKQLKKMIKSTRQKRILKAFV